MGNQASKTYYKISKKENLAHLELGIYFWAQQANINLERVLWEMAHVKLKKEAGNDC